MAAQRGLRLTNPDSFLRKAQAAKKAVNERQELRSLQRDIKDKQEALDDLRDKLEQAGASEERLRREEQTLDSRAETVCGHFDMCACKMTCSHAVAPSYRVKASWKTSRKSWRVLNESSKRLQRSALESGEFDTCVTPRS